MAKQLRIEIPDPQYDAVLALDTQQQGTLARYLGSALTIYLAGIDLKSTITKDKD